MRGSRLRQTASLWHDAKTLTHPGRGYLQHLDGDGLADWAAEHETSILLLVRPGNYVFPGAPVAAR